MAGWLPIVPASLFGMVLGFAGLGNAWRVAHRVWGLPIGIGEALLALATLVWVVLITLYIAKWILRPAIAREELDHPVQCCFIALIGVTTMLIAYAALPYSLSAAWILYVPGALFTVGFAVWRTGGLWQGGRDPAATTAILYLPTGAGSFVIATVAAALGHPDWGQLAVGAGVFSWFAIESVLIHRLFTSPALAAPLRPTLGIQLAPPTVGCIAYLAVTEGPPDIWAHAMLGYGVLQALVLLRMLPWIRSQPFVPSYWAFAFGAAAIATAPLRMIERGDHGIVATLAPVLFIAANLVIGLIALGTSNLLLRGRLLATPVAPAAGD